MCPVPDDPPAGSGARLITVDPAAKSTSLAALEGGNILFFPRIDFSLTARELAVLTAPIPGRGRKNISFDPVTCAIGGVDSHAAHSGCVRELSRRFAAFADDFARDLLRPRVWRVGGPFADVAAHFLPSLPRPSPMRARLLAAVGLTKGVRSAYDQTMLALHDRMKRDDAWQRDARSTQIAFPPGAAWMCFTDQVPHAALSGHLALEQTFHVPISAMAQPDRAPSRVLRQLAMMAGFPGVRVGEAAAEDLSIFQ